jgi:hypothetical protein
LSEKSRDTRSLTKAITEAYLESAFSVMALRIPEVNSYLRENFPTASVATSFPKENIIIKSKSILEDIHKEGLKDVESLRRSFNHLNSMFLSAMWDTLRSHSTYEKIATKPEVQFLRHLRNAAAHDGRFNFSELRHRATWRSKEITLDMIDKPVFPNFLKPGDPVLIVLDIDRLYFEQPGEPAL